MGLSVNCPLRYRQKDAMVEAIFGVIRTMAETIVAVDQAVENKSGYKRIGYSEDSLIPYSFNLFRSVLGLIPSTSAARVRFPELSSRVRRINNFSAS